MKAKHVFSILSIMVIVALLAAAFPQGAQAALCKRTHTVRADDTLSKIARRYHTTSTKIAYANNLDKPYELTVGQSLCIPSDNVPKTRFKWNAVIRGDQVFLNGDDFRKNHAFLVNAKTSSKDRFYSLGKTVTNAGGDLSAFFTLPAVFAGKDYITLCVKDKSSKLTDCKRIFRQ